MIYMIFCVFYFLYVLCFMYFFIVYDFLLFSKEFLYFHFLTCFIAFFIVFFMLLFLVFSFCFWSRQPRHPGDRCHGGRAGAAWNRPSPAPDLGGLRPVVGSQPQPDVAKRAAGPRGLHPDDGLGAGPALLPCLLQRGIALVRFPYRPHKYRDLDRERVDEEGAPVGRDRARQ